MGAVYAPNELFTEPEKPKKKSHFALIYGLILFATFAAFYLYLN